MGGTRTTFLETALARELWNRHAVEIKLAALRRHVAHPYQALALVCGKGDF